MNKEVPQKWSQGNIQHNALGIAMGSCFVTLLTSQCSHLTNQFHLAESLFLMQGRKQLWWGFLPINICQRFKVDFFEVVIVGETAVFCLQMATRDFENQEKTILTGDCCYINPLVRRTVRFLGIYAFGLFATDIFVNAGQVVTGNLAPHFLALCKPNYTALGCQQFTQFVSGAESCSGNPDLVMKARKTFPSKEAALSIYAATYITDLPLGLLMPSTESLTLL
ncbi:hypothetical protein E2320_010494 [Naja naja]|nr:hypothetical protein E2320_010494 [Naja naja]